MIPFEMTGPAHYNRKVAMIGLALDQLRVHGRSCDWTLVADQRMRLEHGASLEHLLPSSTSPMQTVAFLVRASDPENVWASVEACFANGTECRHRVMRYLFPPPTPLDERLMLVKGSLFGSQESFVAQYQDSMDLGVRVARDADGSRFSVAHGVHEHLGTRSFRETYDRMHRWMSVRRASNRLWFLLLPFFAMPLVSSCIGSLLFALMLASPEDAPSSAVIFLSCSLFVMFLADWVVVRAVGGRSAPPVVSWIAREIVVPFAWSRAWSDRKVCWYGRPDTVVHTKY